MINFEKEMKKELIKIIKKNKIIDIVYEPRYIEGYYNERVWIGSTITIRTENTGDKNGKKRKTTKE